MWFSPRFQLLLVKEYQRLKEQEQTQVGWNAKRELSKINYRIHTDAIKQNLIPTEVTPKQISSRPLKSTHLRDIARKQCPADFFNK